MKRMSIAEQTLEKQIERAKWELGQLDLARADIKSKYDVLLKFKNDMEAEQYRLEKARKKASDRQKSAND